MYGSLDGGSDNALFTFFASFGALSQQVRSVTNLMASTIDRPFQKPNWLPKSPESSGPSV